MKTGHLAKYAPAARRAFIAAVTARAAAFGLTAKGVAPMTEQGDLVLIGDRPYPRSVAAIRRKLEQRIKQHGFAQVMEAMAYTWFNRLVAIRYMELHGYLDHGRRVLSHPDKPGGFEILDSCTEIDLPALNRSQILELKLDGNKDEELYRLLLLGQCRALHQAMPFLFEAIEDETELLLPDNLTKTDSLIRRLVDDIPEADWQQVEIVGWLYQFYISEKKDQVIGKVVKSEDIPAATQLFTPNWIVKYMVQNSLGAQWLATYPNSPLRQQMEYYIEPAEQTEEVQAQLKAITPTSLDPEHLTLMDPACGSGHILVEAYELFKAIYLERGYRQRDIPKLILEKNLYGLEIDPRAAQLTGFALMMKGHADDRRLFERGVKLNVMALVDSEGFDAEKLVSEVDLSEYGLQSRYLTELKCLFEHATTFGSLIQVPEELAKKLQGLKRLSDMTSQDLFVSDALKSLRLLVQQTQLLAAQYNAVVANPPYLGGKGMNAALKAFVREHYTSCRPNLFASFMQRAFTFTFASGITSMVTLHDWMYLSRYETFRAQMLQEQTLLTLIDMPYSGRGPTPMPISFGVSAWSVGIGKIRDYVAQFSSARFHELTDDGEPKTFPPDNDRKKSANVDSFGSVPGSPLIYAAPNAVIQAFSSLRPLSDVSLPRQGMATGDDEKYVRLWHEIDRLNLGFGCTSKHNAWDSNKKWFPFNKGGPFRKWYGNSMHVIAFNLSSYEELKAIGNHCPSEELYFLEAVNWSDIASKAFGARYRRAGEIFATLSMSVFPTEYPAAYIAAFLNSTVNTYIVGLTSPGLHYSVGYVARQPVCPVIPSALSLASACIGISEQDWDGSEISWDFQSTPLLTASCGPTAALPGNYSAWINQSRDTIAKMKHLEEENNRLFIDAYGLADELTPDVPIEQITLTVNPAYRYGGKLTEEEQWTRFRQDTMQELVSYAIGCMMGRYSLDEPGLIYAHSGNEGFDPSRYSNFPADDDGIVPLTDTEWFDDDATHRLIEFISVAWDKRHLEANLTFLADNLSRKKSESSRETLRRYLCDSFYKDHLQTYKNRPIYWLFSSGKHKAFQCLVYLHRYNEGTLARMRTEYVIPLQGLIASRIERLDADIVAASSTAHRKRLEKEKDKLVKQRAELQRFDEKLRHYADQRINLDLDDGVKVNYGKFGDLLAEVKKVTGGKAET